MCEIAGFDCSITSWSDIASIATLLGGASIFFALLQLRQQSDVARSTFENLFVAQYQQLIQQLPIMALLGHELSDNDRRKYLQEFYHYVDLCNTQAYHYTHGRISESTWREWREGIEANFRRPELQMVWSYIAEKSPNEFSDLRALIVPAPYPQHNPYDALTQSK